MPPRQGIAGGKSQLTQIRQAIIALQKIHPHAEVATILISVKHAELIYL